MVGARSVAVCGAALLLVAGCGGGNSARSGGASATETSPKTLQPAAVATALKAQLEASLLQLSVQKVDCTRQGEDFSCQVTAIIAGQPRSGRMKLAGQGTAGSTFVGSGMLAGTGGHIKISRIVIDLTKPAPAKPPGLPGRSPLEQAIELTLEQRDPQLIITSINCPGGKATGAGAHFTCKAQGPYGVSPAVILIRVEQTNASGKRFTLSGDIDFTDPTGRKAHGSFRNLKVVIP